MCLVSLFVHNLSDINVFLTRLLYNPFNGDDSSLAPSGSKIFYDHVYLRYFFKRTDYQQHVLPG